MRDASQNNFYNKTQCRYLSIKILQGFNVTHTHIHIHIIFKFNLIYRKILHAKIL